MIPGLYAEKMLEINKLLTLSEHWHKTKMCLSLKCSLKYNAERLKAGSHGGPWEP